MDHEVSVLLVNLGCLRRILAAEKFWQTLLLKITDLVFKCLGVKPSESGTWNVDGVLLAPEGLDWLSQLHDGWRRHLFFRAKRLNFWNYFFLRRRLLS
jgi:hypothetical protein